MAGVKGRSGGRRPGAGRKAKPRPPPSIAEVAPALYAELAGIRTLIERTLKTQSADIARLRREPGEYDEMILRRLVELEKLVRGDSGLAKPPRHTRSRPLGLES
jgi:hypothetical protein